MVDKVDKIWLDGELVPWDAAQVHILTHTLHYGLGAFEGIRAYKLTDGRSAIFRLKEHIERLYLSCKIIGLDIPFGFDAVMQAHKDVLEVNHLDAAYLRPLAFLGDGAMGLGALSNPTRLAVAAWRWGAYLGEEGLERGIRARISSYARNHHNAVHPKGKVCGHYVNNILAKREALRDGYDEAIMLDTEGFVSEASGENLFVVQGDTIVTAPYGASILGGITRDSVMRIASDLGYRLKEERFARDILYGADEVFMTGTAAEVTPVREIDGRVIGAGKAGPVTKAVQTRYFAAVHGEIPEYAGWLAVYDPKA